MATSAAEDRSRGRRSPCGHDHTDAFYVPEGELTFEVGRPAEAITVPAGGLVVVPPGVVHSFGSAGARPARWLTIHAPDGGFAAFMRGLRDGLEADWDTGPGSRRRRSTVIARGRLDQPRLDPRGKPSPHGVTNAHVGEGAIRAELCWGLNALPPPA